jgi:hypothetical protein
MFKSWSGVQLYASSTRLPLSSQIRSQNFQIQSQSYVTTDGQSESSLISGQGQIFVTVKQLRFLDGSGRGGQSKSYFTTGDSPPISSSWCQAS